MFDSYTVVNNEQYNIANAALLGLKNTELITLLSVKQLKKSMPTDKKFQSFLGGIRGGHRAHVGQNPRHQDL